MLYFLSPKAYNLLSKLLTLPSRRTLQRMTENIYLRPELNNKVVFKALEIKAKTMKKMDKDCLLCIDEMSLKSNLFYRTKSDEIWDLRTLETKRKMKAADMRNVLEECIEKLIQTGLIVEGIASDMGSNFLELSKSLCVDAQSAEFVLAGKNLVYIFVPCHLIKATRNNLLKHILLEMKIFDKSGKEITNRVKFTECWAVTIQALLKLWEKLSKDSFKYLETRGINTDCIENLFGSVR
nr:unnamed protein product [Callosobruchus analis]